MKITYSHVPIRISATSTAGSGQGTREEETQQYGPPDEREECVASMAHQDGAQPAPTLPRLRPERRAILPALHPLHHLRPLNCRHWRLPRLFFTSTQLINLHYSSPLGPFHMVYHHVRNLLFINCSFRPRENPRVLETAPRSLPIRPEQQRPAAAARSDPCRLGRHGVHAHHRRYAAILPEMQVLQAGQSPSLLQLPEVRHANGPPLPMRLPAVRL